MICSANCECIVMYCFVLCSTVIRDSEDRIAQQVEIQCIVLVCACVSVRECIRLVV